MVKDKTIGDYKIYEEKATIKATVRRAKGDKSPFEISVKFQLPQLHAELAARGFTVARSRTDEGGDFSLTLARAAG